MQALSGHQLIDRSRRLTSTLLAAGACFAFNATAPRAIAAEVRVFARACADQEVKVVTSLEDHGIASDISADQLGAAGLLMLEARSTCYAGKVEEAVALYQRVIDLKGRIAEKR
jgi:hypothetical protein